MASLLREIAQAKQEKQAKDAMQRRESLSTVPAMAPSSPAGAGLGLIATLPNFAGDGARLSEQGASSTTTSTLVNVIPPPPGTGTMLSQNQKIEQSLSAMIAHQKLLLEQQQQQVRAASASASASASAEPKLRVSTYKKRPPPPCEASRYPPGWLHPGPEAKTPLDPIAGKETSTPSESSTIPNLPPKSGMGLKLRPSRMLPQSCVPPPYAEMTLAVDRTPTGPAAHLSRADSQRMSHPSSVLNTLVYDSLQPRPSFENLNPSGLPENESEGDRSTGGEGGGDGRGTGGSTTSLMRSREYGLDTGEGARSSFHSVDSPREGGPRGSEPIGRSSLPTPPLNPSSSSLPSQDFDYLPGLPCWYSPSSQEDDTLVFESRFESGNLRRALLVKNGFSREEGCKVQEYDLVLRPDVNTKGHTQWFYFSVSNTRKGTRYRFNILNLMKGDSLYNDGMQPLVHSERDLLEGSKVGWRRQGEKVAYYENTIPRTKKKHYYTLSFTLTFSDHDLVHVSHCYPYTYTDLQRYLAALDVDPDKEKRRIRLKREVLCTTLAGNPCDLLTITSMGTPEALKKRRGVIVSSRVHPGETNASWMMKGVIDFLMGPSPDAKKLRDAFVFKVIPMLNPDGVIVGNYRCSLAGLDLNRVWNEPQKKLHPTIHSLKSLAKGFSEEREVAMFIDLHGHSRKKGIFLYGAEKIGPKDLHPMYTGYPIPGSIGGLPPSVIPMRHQEKVYPLLLQHNLPDIFSYAGCNFKVQKSKGGTGRVVGFRELGLVNSFTLEASFCGATGVSGAAGGRWAGSHFNTWHLEQMGAAVCTALLDYWDPESYGMGALLAELDFMHPPESEGGRRKFITTADGELVEVDADDDDDEAPTDSDDSEEDEEEKAARKQRQAARKQQRQVQAVLAAFSGGANIPTWPLPPLIAEAGTGTGAGVTSPWLKPPGLVPGGSAGGSETSCDAFNPLGYTPPGFTLKGLAYLPPPRGPASNGLVDETRHLVNLTQDIPEDRSNSTVSAPPLPLMENFTPALIAAQEQMMTTITAAATAAQQAGPEGLTPQAVQAQKEAVAQAYASFAAAYAAATGVKLPDPVFPAPLDIPPPPAPLTKKQIKRQEQKAWLKAEQQKASDGLADILPLFAESTVFGHQSPQADIKSYKSGPLTPQYQAQAQQAQALEYAKARGIYRGDDLSWANSVLPAASLPPPPIPLGVSLPPSHLITSRGQQHEPEQRSRAPSRLRSSRASLEQEAMEEEEEGAVGAPNSHSLASHSLASFMESEPLFRS